MQQAPPPPQPLSRIKLRGQTKKRVAARLLQFHLAGQRRLDGHGVDGADRADRTSPGQTPAQPPPIRVVCVSDTHNTRPELPPGDILVHAGDLTDNGSFAEMQAGLAWLAAQPHRHKIFVAGNHDVLLDDAFLAAHPARRYGQDAATQTRAHLDWGGVTYLQDRCVELVVGDEGDGDDRIPPRTVSVYGAPWTPAYGVSAFQYGPADAAALWAARLGGFPRKTGGGPDILVTHGPPKLRRDQRDWHRAGCAHLAAHVARLRPRLVVFGHIHAGHGREDAVAGDAARWQHDRVVFGWFGWGGVAWLAVLVAAAAVRRAAVRVCFWRRRPRPAPVTTFVNAAVVGGPANELRNAPIVVDI